MSNNSLVETSYPLRDYWKIKLLRPLRHISVIRGKSMYPTLKNGETVITSNNRTFQRGDIVSFLVTQQGYIRILIKRIIGLPGDKIVIRNSDNYLIINDKWQSEKYLKSMYNKNYRSTKGGLAKMYKVPEGHFFMLGDNRRDSFDSRNFGPIPMCNILNKVVAVTNKSGSTQPLRRPVYVGVDDPKYTAKFDASELIKYTRRLINGSSKKF